MENKRYAVKVFYLGYRYYGFQRQPDVPTVEGEIIKTLKSLKMMSEEPRYTAASRTDRGAHAIGQTIAFNATRELDLTEINEKLPSDIIFWAYSLAPNNFNARKKALYRHYKYIAENPGIDLDKVNEALKHIIGVHNFKNLCYKASRSTIRRIYLAKASLIDSNYIEFDFYGASFARGLIRKTVTACLKVGLGEMSLSEFKQLLNPTYAYARGIRPAPPEGLFLVDAFYPIAFTIDAISAEKVEKALTNEISRENLSRKVAEIMLAEFRKLREEIEEQAQEISRWTFSSSLRRLSH